MKQIFFKLSTVLLLFLFIGASCDEETEYPVNIEPIPVEGALKIKLDSIFSSENSCLKKFSNDTVCHVLYSEDDFLSIDDCNDISEIDFSIYSLIVGKIQVGSINDSIFDIVLSNVDEKYNIEIQLEMCTECYGAIGQLYFWRLYPALDPYYEKNISVTEK